jgi:hypothetical protein
VNAVAVDRFFRNPRTGEVVIAQPPNPPALVFTAAELLRRVRPSPVLRVIAIGALAWWSVGEIGRGASPFRRALGAVVPVGYVAMLTRRRPATG